MMAEVVRTYYENGSELSDNSKRKNLSSTDSFGKLETEYFEINDKKNGEFK